MLTEICQYLKNWFNRGQKQLFGEFTIQDNQLNISDIQTGQYYRIVGSVFNDGVHKKGSETLINETFNGSIWLMAVPQDVVALANEIADWQSKYGTTESENMSPFQSESFGGYSYSKSSGGSASATSSSVPTWQAVYADQLRRYKKL